MKKKIKELKEVAIVVDNDGKEIVLNENESFISKIASGAKKHKGKLIGGLVAGGALLGGFIIGSLLSKNKDEEEAYEYEEDDYSYDEDGDDEIEIVEEDDSIETES